MAGNTETLRQEQQLRQQQRLNPNTVALGRLLEMSVPELEDEIRREVDDNPALEVIETGESLTHTSDFGESSDDDSDFEDYVHADEIPVHVQKRKSSAPSNHADPGGFAPDDGDSLIDALMRLLSSEQDLDARQLRIAEHIIGELDSNGYLSRNLSDIATDIAMTEDFEPSRADMQYVFDAIRALDPAGIGAVDLRDCLMLQLERMPSTPRVQLARKIIGKNFELFSKKHFDRLEAKLAVTREQLADALALIRALNPKPASALDLARHSDSAGHITPDVAVDYDDDTDKFTITLLGDLPELGIEETFAADEPAHIVNATGKERRAEAFAFIQRKRDDARTFIRLLQMRSATMLAVVRAIVTIQRRFFLSGEKADIRPMILRNVAAATGLDLPVISRATAGKYVLTPHGVFPLKLLFNERPAPDADVSSHEILETIADLIESEDKNEPLSDRELCDALAAKGYDIARRTVAKYRERLGQPVARLRKQL